MTIEPNSNDPNPSGPALTYGVTDPTGSGSSTDYDPTAVQQMIDNLLYTVKQSGKPMTEGEMSYCMYLMQEYGLQEVGVQNTNMTSMNAYMDKIHELYADLNNAKGWVYTSSDPIDPTTAFTSALNALLDGLTSNSFFVSGDGAPMVSQISGVLEDMKSISTSAGGLEALWNQFDGTTPGTSVINPSGGNSTQMTTMNSSLGELTQQYTGASGTLAAVLKALAAIQTTEMDTMSNFIKKINSAILYIAGQSKTQ